MFTKTLLPDTLRAIKLASTISAVKKAYLAGGTSLALQLGHRMSVDLDFFTQEEIDENIIAANLLKFPQFKEKERAWRTVIGLMGETKFSIFYYPYKIIDPFLSFEGIQLLTKKDIAAMKIHAICDRGPKRDFIDIYMLAKEYSLDQMLDFYDQKYGVLEDKLYIILKGLHYFADAEVDEMPQMLTSVNWEEVKIFFHKEVRRLAKERLNLKI